MPTSSILAQPTVMVDATRSAPLSDAVINAEIEALLDRAPSVQVEREPLYVRTTDHVTYLQGEVNTPFERAQAEDIVRRAPDLQKLVDLITSR